MTAAAPGVHGPGGIRFSWPRAQTTGSLSISRNPPTDTQRNLLAAPNPFQTPPDGLAA